MYRERVPEKPLFYKKFVSRSVGARRGLSLRRGTRIYTLTSVCVVSRRLQPIPPFFAKTVILDINLTLPSLRFQYPGAQCIRVALFTHFLKMWGNAFFIVKTRRRGRYSFPRGSGSPIHCASFELC